MELGAATAESRLDMLRLQLEAASVHTREQKNLTSQPKPQARVTLQEIMLNSTAWTARHPLLEARKGQAAIGQWRHEGVGEPVNTKASPAPVISTYGLNAAIFFLESNALSQQWKQLKCHSLQRLAQPAPPPCTTRKVPQEQAHGVLASLAHAGADHGRQGEGQARPTCPPVRRHVDLDLCMPVQLQAGESRRQPVAGVDPQVVPCFPTTPFRAPAAPADARLHGRPAPFTPRPRPASASSCTRSVACQTDCVGGGDQGATNPDPVATLLRLLLPLLVPPLVQPVSGQQPCSNEGLLVALRTLIMSPGIPHAQHAAWTSPSPSQQAAWTLPSHSQQAAWTLPSHSQQAAWTLPSHSQEAGPLQQASSRQQEQQEADHLTTSSVPAPAEPSRPATTSEARGPSLHPPYAIRQDPTPAPSMLAPTPALPDLAGTLAHVAQALSTERSLLLPPLPPLLAKRLSKYLQQRGKAAPPAAAADEQPRWVRVGGATSHAHESPAWVGHRCHHQKEIIQEIIPYHHSPKTRFTGR